MNRLDRFAVAMMVLAVVFLTCIADTGDTMMICITVLVPVGIIYTAMTGGTA